MATLVTPPPLSSATDASAAEAAAKLDIVVVLGDLKSPSLDAWIPVLVPYHLIVIHEQEQHDFITSIAQGRLDCESHSMADVKSALGPDLASALSSKAAMARCFGVLTSRRKFVAFVDLDSSSPAKDPATGELVDPFKQHLVNLGTPATPFFFNTLYDPFRKGTDFVRGYPFSLRTGAPTAVSHGLWLDPTSKQQQYVDAVLTVPKDALFAMSGINVAFDRELIGPGLFFGAATEGGLQDLWAGLCAKAICDHLGYGIKSGLPYLICNQTQQQQKQEAATEMHEAIFRFFQTIKLPATATCGEDCYLEIAKLVKANAKLGKISSSMESWIGAWKKTSSSS